MKKVIMVCFGLLFVNSAMAAGSESCALYKTEIDSYLSKMKEMGTQQSQLDMLKQQFEQSLSQMKNLPADSQEMTCKQGLDALRQMMKSANMQ
ncbi:DUF5339 domain-containing protein [Citrobacter arsenatis]|uniref:DUF5339 domain-containing protein n=1 Tax=Citrobacter arsenatis TaxID=2546350 RepID=UPI00300DFC88